MFRLLFIVALVAQSSLAKPTNCVLFCDEPQIGSYVQAPSQGHYAAGYAQAPSQGHFGAGYAQAPSYGSFVQPQAQAPYSMYNGFVRPTHALSSGRLQQNPEVGFVQPGYYPTYGRSRMSQAQVQPVQTQSAGLEAMFHQTASQSSQSSSSSTGFLRQFPTINAVQQTPVQQEPLRRPAKLCVNEYVDPCY